MGRVLLGPPHLYFTRKGSLSLAIVPLPHPQIGPGRAVGGCRRRLLSPLHPGGGLQVLSRAAPGQHPRRRFSRSLVRGRHGLLHQPGAGNAGHRQPSRLSRKHVRRPALRPALPSRSKALPGLFGRTGRHRPIGCAGRLSNGHPRHGQGNGPVCLRPPLWHLQSGGDRHRRFAHRRSAARGGARPAAKGRGGLKPPATLFSLFSCAHRKSGGPDGLFHPVPRFSISKRLLFFPSKHPPPPPLITWWCAPTAHLILHQMGGINRV